MAEILPAPEVLECYFDHAFDPHLPAMSLRWGQGLATRERLWHLPEGVCLDGAAPERFGLHVQRLAADSYSVRVLWNQTRTGKMSSVEQIKQLVRISTEFGRPIATAQQAREIMQIGVFYETAEETLQANGFAPNRKGGNQGFLRKPA